MAEVTGGSKLIERLEQIVEAIRPASGRVGLLADATYPDGTSVALVGVAQEFGTSNIPPRPFMRHSIPAIKADMAMAGALLVVNKYDSEKTVSQLLEIAKGHIIESINSNIPPPNAPSTEKAKGFNRTLIDTGHLVHSVDWELD